jgi:hypothetical protein
MSFASDLALHLSADELKIVKSLNSPAKIQDYLDALRQNNSKIGSSITSPRQVLKSKKAHCIEGALLACTSLLFNRQYAWLMDLRASSDDEDHVVCLFRQNGFWGAISKTNHPVLRWRDPIYKTVRELAVSYFNEYFLFADEHFDKKVLKKKLGSKTLRAYSKPFAISKYGAKAIWLAKDLDWLAEELDESPHYPIVPKSAIKKLRKAALVEIKAANLEQFKQR